MTVPTEHTEFVPEKIDLGIFRSWELKGVESSDLVEIHNLIFSRKMIGTIIAMVVFMTFIISIGTAGVLASNNLGLMPKPLFIVGFVSAGFFATGVLIAILIYSVSSNASHWKGGLRLQYTKSTGEIFFPRENVRYSRDDYDELVLQTTDGYDIAEMVERLERNANSNKRRYSEPTLITQVYFLVHRKDGTWTWHLIAYEQHSEAIRKDIAKIQEAIQSPMVHRTMSQKECYAAQHKIADPESILTKPPKPIRFGIGFYCFMSVFVLFGFGFVGMGCFHLYTANASLSWLTTEGTITRSERYKSTPDISYDYTVEGKQYTGGTYQYGALHTRGRTEQIVAQYSVGTVVKVYYSPQSPEKSVLIPGAGVGAYIGIGFGFLFSLIALGVMFLIPFVFRSVDSAVHSSHTAPYRSS
jgi:hypothetical protein